MLMNLMLSIMDAGGPVLLYGLIGGTALLVVLGIGFLVVVAAVVILIVVLARNKKKKAVK